MQQGVAVVEAEREIREEGTRAQGCERGQKQCRLEMRGRREMWVQGPEDVGRKHRGCKGSRGRQSHRWLGPELEP